MIGIGRFAGRRNFSTAGFRVFSRVRVAGINADAPQTSVRRKQRFAVDNDLEVDKK
jgi:hypothetical protein